MKLNTLFHKLSLFALILFVLTSSYVSAQDVTINIAWAEWDPANFLIQLSKDFTQETGIKVVVDKIPWGQYETKVFTTFAAKPDTYDIVIGDSQWLGKGATGGHYMDLTNWMKSKNLDKDISPMALKYLGEYPKGSKKYYAVPAETDCNGFAYRKDLFEDAKEKQAFRAKYKYELGVPKTYSELRDIAEFFTRPKANPPLYGVALWLAKDYDSVTMGFDQILWSFGGSLGDEKTYKVQGILNNDVGVKALQYYVDLAKFTPPGSENYYWSESLTALQQGKVAMGMDFFAFFPGLLSKEKTRFADKMGFFASPAGPGGRFISIGGQGMSVSKHSKYQQEALKFIEWFCKYENQLKWAKLGGFSANDKVLQSKEFQSIAPYNPAFVESMKYVRDFWAVPEYAELLQACQVQWNAAVTKQKTPKQAMDELAKEHEAIFKKAGYPK
jgi:multiple sugar transport system substrate-binding protein